MGMPRRTRRSKEQAERAVLRLPKRPDLKATNFCIICMMTRVHGSVSRSAESLWIVDVGMISPAFFLFYVVSIFFCPRGMQNGKDTRMPTVED